MCKQQDGEEKNRHQDRRPEADAAEAEAKFKTLFDNVSSGVAIYEAANEGDDFIIVDFNRAAQEIEKLEKTKVLGKSVLEVFPGIRDFGLLDVFKRVWKTGTPEHHPVSTYSDNRIAGWRENYVYRLPSGRIVAVYDDVTRNKRNELARQMSEQCFRAIADYTYDWEVWVSPGGRPLWTNPAVLRVTGYTIKELLAMSDYPAPVVLEQDRQRISKAFRSALRGSTGNDVEFRIQRKDGKVAWAEMSWQPIYDEKGMSLGHRQSIRDITARKKAQEALSDSEHEKRTILDNLAELVVYLDRDMTVLWANRAAYRSVQMTREELIGRRCYDLWSDGKGPCTDCPVARAVSTGKTEEGERQTPDGRVWFQVGSPVRDSRGEIIGAVEIALDITERKHAEEALRESEARYRRLVEESRDDH